MRYANTGRLTSLTFGNIAGTVVGQRETGRECRAIGRYRIIQTQQVLVQRTGGKNSVENLNVDERMILK
jgi:hypothetical protein